MFSYDYCVDQCGTAVVIVLTSGTAVVIFFTSGMLRYGVDRWTAVVILMTSGPDSCSNCCELLANVAILLSSGHLWSLCAGDGWL